MNMPSLNAVPSPEPEKQKAAQHPPSIIVTSGTCRNVAEDKPVVFASKQLTSLRHPAIPTAFEIALTSHSFTLKLLDLPAEQTFSGFRLNRSSAASPRQNSGDPTPCSKPVEAATSGIGGLRARANASQQRQFELGKQRRP